ncbi:response regulator transcription factor [Phenylobacterium sp.]|uniref:response regulator transcription factor n=1 Tax=Phenylobacterium sp. TaxID=1871053 RepID=UPI0025F79F93|nr:response regulator transcription factor [Phenylobacterium sp.]
MGATVMAQAARIEWVGGGGAGAGLADYLEWQGYAVERRDAAARPIDLAPVDLVIVQTPRLTPQTLDLCQRSVGAGAAPCVLVVSSASDPEERIQALEAGAADCLAAPFSPRELLARVRAVLRLRPQPALAARPGWAFGGWRLDPARRELSAPDGEPIVLPPGEFALLRGFLAQPQHVLSRETLESLWSSSDRAHDPRVLDVRIARLRARFTRAGGRDFIETVRGEGYRFASPVQAPE